MPHRRTCRQSMTGDDPRGLDRNVLGPRAGEDAHHHVANSRPGLPCSAHHAADDARSDVEVAGTVHRHFRGIGHEPRDRN